MRVHSFLQNVAALRKGARQTKACLCYICCRLFTQTNPLRGSPRSLAVHGAASLREGRRCHGVPCLVRIRARSPERLKVFCLCPPCTPKHPCSSLQMLAIARAMAALCASISGALTRLSGTGKKLSTSEAWGQAHGLIRDGPQPCCNTRRARAWPLSQAPSTLPPCSQSPHRPRRVAASQAQPSVRAGAWVA